MRDQPFYVPDRKTAPPPREPIRNGTYWCTQVIGATLMVCALVITGTAQDRPLIGRTQVLSAIHAAASLPVPLTRISVASDGTEANGASRSPGITADGRFVVFVSFATNLAAGATAGQPNIFLRDTLTGKTTLLASASDLPRVTPDGRYVSYHTIADAGSLQVLDRLTDTRATLAATSSISDDFRYAAKAVGDFGSQTVSVVDRLTGNSTAIGEGNDPILSGDGRFVIYWRIDSSSSLSAWLTDLSAGTSRQVLRGGSSVPRGVRANRYLLFSNTLENTFSAFPATNVIDLVTGQPVITDSYGASVSASGRYIAYANASGDRHDVYLLDQQTNALVRVSVPANGGVANGDSGSSAIDDSGHVVFSSAASNLVPGDANNATDVFLAAGGVDANVPTQPRSLIATVSVLGASATVDLSWQAPATGGLPTNYLVEAGSAPGSSDLANFSNGPATSLHAAIPLGRTIFVRVRAMNSSGVSLPSNEVSFTAGGGTPPGPPTSLAIAGRGQS